MKILRDGKLYRLTPVEEDVVFRAQQRIYHVGDINIRIDQMQDEGKLPRDDSVSNLVHNDVIMDQICERYEDSMASDEHWAELAEDAIMFVVRAIEESEKADKRD